MEEEADVRPVRVVPWPTESDSSPSVNINTLPVPHLSSDNASQPWEKEWERNLPLLGSLSNRLEQHQTTVQPSLNILRVNQVDAAQLDDELTIILRTSLMKIFSFWQVNALQF